jgi:hypothetical protein
MGFFVALLVSLAITIVGELLRPKQKPQNAKASGLDDFSLPTAEEGRSIPILAGKVKINGPNVTAYGDLEAVALTKKVKTGLFSSARQTYAHKYFLGMQMALCWGREDLQIHEIRFGDAMPAHTRTDEGNGCTRFDFDDEDFFGGNEKEGGITGTLRFYNGSDAQTANAYLAGLVGEAVPAYKKLSHAILEKMYLGTSPYIKAVSYIVSSYPNQLNVADGHHIIGDDANPACFIYEVITNPIWGVGLQPNDIDQAQFQEVAETLYEEGYGMSVLYNGGSSARDIISDILRHIDGVIFSDPQTGLISLRLARGDYLVESLPHYGPDDFLEGIKFTRPTWSETKNVIRGTFVNREADYSVDPVTQQDLANISQRNGEIAMEEIDFTGFSNYTPCALAVARALKTLAYPLAKISGDLPRSAWKLKPADVIVVSWPNLGIVEVPFRIVSVRYGGLRSNSVGIEAVEDIFAISEIAYVQPPPSGWVDPLGPVQPLLRQDIRELPYPMIPLEGSVIATYATRSGGLEEGYKVMSKRGAGSYEGRGQSSTFTPSGLVANAWPASSDAIEAVGPEVNQVRLFAQIDNDIPIGSMPTSPGLARVTSSAGEEWIAYQAVDDNLLNVWRGIFDTPPIDHPAGAVVWFASSGYGVESSEPYGAALTVAVKLLPFNARGSLSPDDATEMSTTTSLRASRPLPPGRIRVDDVHPLDVVGVSSPFVLSWAHRNRMHPTLLDQNAESVDPEDGTTYNLRAYNDDTNTLLIQADGFGDSASFALNYTGNVRLEIRAERDGLLSHKPQVFVLDHDADGTVTNVITIDEPSYILDGGEP